MKNEQNCNRPGRPDEQAPDGPATGPLRGPALHLRGVAVWPGFLSPAEQADLVADLRGIARQAPFASQVTPGGRPMSVRMTAAGQFGWISGRGFQGYAAQQPDGRPWPPIPARVLAIWDAVSGSARAPESLLVNFYGEGARMGLHQDRDEADFSCPVVSISLGDDGLFRVGNRERGGRTESLWLRSGDVVVLGGESRLVHHGVDRIRFRSSALLPQGGRINLTLRIVT
ncbi:alpha-ketoglutarate-dependent dioxygenase AlkB family protein [Plastorhodobacter daqingensis]|uniref:Alpha-ketoglutarate-dependent dioxygenase AlkB family protein n=1 Tax=Plastorhodobacter daqingensis TaxID=1387281 RepID=A0ABW2UFD2_9RHOB